MQKRKKNRDMSSEFQFNECVAECAGASGLASGIDWTSIVSEMLTVEAAPETQMTAQETDR